MTRAASILLCVLLGGNGVVMLFAGAWWYGAVPGVTMTGPYNPHFVKDIGAAYLVCALAYGWLAARPTSSLARGAAITSALFLVLHAAIHIADAVAGDHAGADFARDFAGVFLPALLASWLVRPRPTP